MRFGSLDCLTDLLDYETILVHNPSNVNMSVWALLDLIIKKIGKI
jgi:hypothetical protein